MTREEIFQDIESMTVGLDDTFKFHCTQCGKCCRNRDDILLSAYDIYKMSKALKMTPSQFFAKYCRSHIGDNSRVPIVRLISVGKDDRCPLLRNNKCSVHHVKPAVCAMFPLGRYIVLDKNESGKPSMEGCTAKYLLQPPECGDTSETHTVREWLADFDIQTEDEFFIGWHTALHELGEEIRKLEKTESMIIMMPLWNMIRITMYLNYDVQKDFLPQFKMNLAKCKILLKNTPNLGKGHAYAG